MYSQRLTLMDITQCFQSDDKAIEYLFMNDVIVHIRTCQCGGCMIQKKKNGRLVWVCPDCCTTMSIFHGSLFHVRFVSF